MRLVVKQLLYFVTSLYINFTFYDTCQEKNIASHHAAIFKTMAFSPFHHAFHNSIFMLAPFSERPTTPAGPQEGFAFTPQQYTVAEGITGTVSMTISFQTIFLNRIYIC